MSDGTLVPLGAVKRAIARLEDKHPEFWDYLDEEVERAIGDGPLSQPDPTEAEAIGPDSPGRP